MIHLGTIPASTTIYIPFTSYAGSTGASVTCTGLAVTDIEIYKNGSTTQRSSDAGVALLDTDGIDFDGITGLHGFSIDLSDNTDASFYAVGSFYWVVVSAITVDSQTVTFLAATFRIGPAEALSGHPKVDVGGWLGTAPATPTVAGVPEVDVTHLLGTAWLTPGTAGTPDVNVKLISDDSTAADNAEAFFDGTGYAGTNNVIPAVTTVTNLTNAPTSGDFTATMKSSITTAVPTVGAIADQVWEEAIVDHSGTSGSTAEALNAAGSAGDPWTTSLPGSYTGTQAGKILADVLVDTGTTLDGKLTTAQNDLDILTGTDGVTLATSQANYAPAKAGDAMALTTSERSTLYTGIWSAGTRTLTSISALASEIASAVWLAASATYGLTLSTMGRLLHNGGAAAADTTATGTPGATSLQITDGSTVDDFYNDMVMYVDSSDGAGQARPITDYVGSTKTLSFDEDLVVLPVSTDRIVIRAAHVHPKTQQAIATREEMDANSTQLADIVEDTNELQTDWANGGRLDLILDARASQSSVDDLPTNAELAAAITTGLTTALTEDYRATGATGSVRDILYEILGHMVNKGIAGTTLTTKKLDKTTTAKTYTLDADPATSIEETT